MILKLDLQRFALPMCFPEPIILNGVETNVDFYDTIIWGVSYKNILPWSPSNLQYTISNGKVIWEDGTILQYNGIDVLPTDAVIPNGSYTTRSNYFTIIKGLYKFVENPTFSKAFELDSLYLTINTLLDDDTQGESKTFNYLLVEKNVGDLYDILTIRESKDSTYPYISYSTKNKRWTYFLSQRNYYIDTNSDILTYIRINNELTNNEFFNYVVGNNILNYVLERNLKYQFKETQSLGTKGTYVVNGNIRVENTIYPSLTINISDDNSETYYKYGSLKFYKYNDTTSSFMWLDDNYTKYGAFTLQENVVLDDVSFYENYLSTKSLYVNYEPTYVFVRYNKSSAEISNDTNYKFLQYNLKKIYKISNKLENIGDSKENIYQIAEDGTIKLTFYPLYNDDETISYRLPDVDKLTATNCNFKYEVAEDKKSATLTIADPTGDITITGASVKLYYYKINIYLDDELNNSFSNIVREHELNTVGLTCNDDNQTIVIQDDVNADILLTYTFDNAYINNNPYYSIENNIIAVQCTQWFLQSPSNLAISDNYDLTFNDVSNANRYDIYIDGVYYTSLGEDEFIEPNVQNITLDIISTYSATLNENTLEVN